MIKRETKPISDTYPELAKEAHGWDPTKVFAGTHKKLEWKCSLGHVWSAVGYSRIAGNKCPYCSNQKVLQGFNDMSTTNPELAKEAHGWDPTKVLATTSLKLIWCCKLNHKWEAPGYLRVKGNKCPSCKIKVK